MLCGENTTSNKLRHGGCSVNPPSVFSLGGVLSGEGIRGHVSELYVNCTVHLHFSPVCSVEGQMEVTVCGYFYERDFEPVFHYVYML